MAKRLKLTTIEKRFKKLHDIANFAEDYARAIAFHAEKLFHEDQTADQQFATIDMSDQLKEWAEKFAPLSSEMQHVEELYYATADSETAELIEAIPSTKGYPTEEPYKLTELLCRIGYVEIEGDPYRTAEIEYTDDELIRTIKEMRQSLVLCIKALANASYQGVWQRAEKLAAELYDTYPGDAIDKLLTSYGVNAL